MKMKDYVLCVLLSTVTYAAASVCDGPGVWMNWTQWFLGFVGGYLVVVIAWSKS